MCTMRRSLQIDPKFRPPSQDHERKYAHGCKILKLLEENITKSIKYVTEMETTTDREILSLLTQANHFSYDIQRIVYQLRKLVIRSFESRTSDVVNLDCVIKQFSLFGYCVHQRLHDDPEVLKIRIKDNLIKIVPESRRLLNFSKQNAIPEYTHDIVYILDNVLFAVQKIVFRNLYENKSIDDLVKFGVDFRDKYISNINQIGSANHSVIHYIQLTVYELCVKAFVLIDNVAEMSNYFEGNIKETMLTTSYNLLYSIALVSLEIRKRGHLLDIMKDLLIKGSYSGAHQIEHLIELLHTKSDDKHDSENVYNIVIQTVILKAINGAQFLRNLEYASGEK